MLRSLVGSEMCIRDRYQRRVREANTAYMATLVLPPHNAFETEAHGSPVHACTPPRQMANNTTITGIVFDRDWSGRTFNIPDCPAKDTVGSLKGWYIRNICPTAKPSLLEIMRTDTLSSVCDDTPFWQLAMGEPAFCVTVLHVQPQQQQFHSRSTSLIMDGPITLYVQHESTGISTGVSMAYGATLLQLKIAAFEHLGLGDATAALDPRVGFSFNGVILDNEATIHACQLSSGDRVYIHERRTPPGSRRSSCANSPSGENHHSLIADIWAHSDSSEDESLTLPPSLLQDNNSDQFTLCKPSQSNNCKSSSSGGRTKRSPRGDRGSAERELERIKLSWRTKMCRAGRGACKFGNSCWFAHSPEDLRKPTDPLPAHCPGVSKLEKYARRAGDSQ
eukprot:TRINITY_DN70_c0_g1_i3.p1 TRINITY_DN70_c0_g1~~TRINITY_DN70_c0_g1_i3.p1  ORF type:complete len:407 (+),score=89.20 TRINITY_DN70_c0_g1_i3:46-1221(+)